MKKVLVMCGSPRPDGNTAQIAKECGGVIETTGFQPRSCFLPERRSSPEMPATDAGTSVSVLSTMA